jgi:hypothetical protein
MVDNQTVNKTNKHLKKRGEKKRKKVFQVQEHWNFSLSSSDITPLASSLIHLHLLGRFGAGIWWSWSPSVVDGSRYASGLAVRAWLSRFLDSGLVGWQLGRPEG